MPGPQSNQPAPGQPLSGQRATFASGDPSAGGGADPRPGQGTPDFPAPGTAVPTVDGSGQWATPFWELPRLPWLLPLAAALWSLWSLRATLLPVAYLDDASVHEQMVRFATRLVQEGRDPLTAWFPYLGEGSPQFLHYQSLGAMLTGLAGTVVGADTAFRWSLYLLVALWPIVVYASARILGIGKWAAAIAGLCAPLLASVPSVGYEHGAYLWIGYGLWAQLWASWALPLAWASTWRALDDRRLLLPAGLAVAATAALHYETGYLAFLAIVVLPWVSPARLAHRLGRAALLLAGSFLASAWVIVPLIHYGTWASTNQVLRGTPLENGYGAGRVLSWLVTGQVYDVGRFPALTLLVATGIVACVVRWRSWPLGRALLVLWTASLLLSFGRTTFGPVVDIVPGATDLFFRRFLMGAQLAGLFLAGVGAVAAGAFVRWAARGLADRFSATEADRRLGRLIVYGLAALLVSWAAVATVLPIARYDARNTAHIRAQHAVQQIQSAQIAPLISDVLDHGGGRTYAGLPTNWGTQLTVGAVPVFKYLESQDVDEVGYTLRTASLMTDPEYYFDEDEPSDYAIFGVRYLILPAGQAPPVPATPVLRRGPYALWTVAGTGYADVVEVTGQVRADRTNIAARTLDVVQSGLVARHRDESVAFAGAAADPPQHGPGASRTGAAEPAGTVLHQPRSLNDGTASTTVRLTRPGTVVLSASFDPGWQVSVDGHPEKAWMLAPAVVGVNVGPGVHRVVFTYHGYGQYPELAVLGLLGLLGLWLCGRRRTA